MTSDVLQYTTQKTKKNVYKLMCSLLSNILVLHYVITKLLQLLWVLFHGWRQIF